MTDRLIVVKRAQDARIRTLERKLSEERMALTAIVKVMLLEVPDPRRMLARLEAMVHAAESAQTNVTLHRELVTATMLVRAAVKMEQRGGVTPEATDALVALTSGEQQLRHVNQESILGDVEAAHGERVDTIKVVHDFILLVLRDEPRTERELHASYWQASMRTGLPRQTFDAFVERRRELSAAWRVRQVGEKDGEPTWGLVEHAGA